MWIMKARPTRDQLVAWRAFLDAHHAVTNVLADELEEIGLPIGFYDVLVQLTEAGSKGLRMADLARKVLISKSGLTRLVDRMQAAGLVTRQSSPEDARGFYVLPTAVGVQALRKATPTHLRGVADHFSSLLTENETSVLSSALRRIAKASGS
jgi:DNA-binding MarR family transcriptional regulator